MDPLQQPTHEHLRANHTDERLRSYRTDRLVPGAIAVFATILWAVNFGPLWLQVAFGIVGIFGAFATIRQTCRDLFAKLKRWKSESDSRP